jgi:hypothetical protein
VALPLDMGLYRGAVAFILSVTALLKFLAVARHERVLAEADPITGMPMAQLAIVAAVMEILLAVFVVFCNRPKWVLIAVHVVALGFVGYHVAMTATGNFICPCLGGGVSWWPWLGRHQDEASTAIALWLWMSTSVLLLPLLRQTSPLRLP